MPFYYYSPTVASAPESLTLGTISNPQAGSCGSFLSCKHLIWFFESNRFIVIVNHRIYCGRKYHLVSVSDCGLHRGVLTWSNENLSQTCLSASLRSHILFLTSVS